MCCVHFDLLAKTVSTVLGFKVNYTEPTTDKLQLLIWNRKVKIHIRPRLWEVCCRVQMPNVRFYASLRGISKSDFHYNCWKGSVAFKECRKLSKRPKCSCGVKTKKFLSWNIRGRAIVQLFSRISASQLEGRVFDPQPLSELPKRSLVKSVHLNRPGQKQISGFGLPPTTVSEIKKYIR